jgi:ABC-type branched-subunit amino acid transport system substrate-binding protein
MNGSRVNAGLRASALGLLLGLAACASDTVAPPAEPVQPAQPQLPPEVRVGLLLPLSGPAEALGRDMLDAAEMALFDVGANDLMLLPRDTAGTPDGARSAARQVIDYYISYSVLGKMDYTIYSIVLSEFETIL